MFTKAEKQALASILNELLQPDCPLAYDASEAVKPIASQFPKEVTEWHYLSALAAPLTSEIEKTTPFVDGKTYTLFSGPGGVGFQSTSAAVALLRHARRSGQASDAIEWLEQLFKGHDEAGTLIMLVSAFPLSSSIRLPGDVTLMPAHNLHLHPVYRPFLENPSHDYRSPYYLRTRPNPPTAALIKRVQFGKVLFHEGENFTNPLDEDMAMLDEIRESLTLVGPSSPMNVACWIHFDDINVADISGLSFSFGNSEIASRWFPIPTEATPNDILSVVSRYLTLHPETREKLRPALLRLNQALRRQPSGDKALDLAIVLESLLVEKGGEITFRLALRCALLYPGDFDKKMWVRAMVEALYQQRSELAHKNISNTEVRLKGQPRMSTYDFLEACVGIVHQVLLAWCGHGGVSTAQWREWEIKGVPTISEPLQTLNPSLN